MGICSVRTCELPDGQVCYTEYYLSSKDKHSEMKKIEKLRLALIFNVVVPLKTIKCHDFMASFCIQH